MRLLGALVLLCLIGTQSGCSLFFNYRDHGKPWKTQLNQELRTQAISQNAKALADIGAPNVAAGASLAHFGALLQKALAPQGIEEVTLEGDTQAIEVSLTFKRVFTGNGVRDERQKAFLDKHRPTIGGRISVYAFLELDNELDAKNQPVVAVRLAPAVSSLKIDTLRLATVDLGIVRPAIEAAINLFKDEISRQLGKQPFVRLAAYPATASVTQAQVESLFTKLLGANAVSSQPFTSDVILKKAAWIVDDNRLIVLSRLALGREPASTSTAAPVGTHEELVARAVGLLGEEFGLTDLDDDVWVSIRKDVPATILNDVAANANICVNGSALATRIEFNERIALPDGSDLSCRQESCTSGRTCSEDIKRDGRDCYGCIVPAPHVCAKIFGKKRCVGSHGCITKGEDPVCVAEREAQNAIYFSRAQAERGACNAQREVEMAYCRTKAVAEKAVCDAGRETLKALAKSGDFARVAGNVDVDAAPLRACVKQLRISPNLQNLDIAVEVAGHAKAAVDVKFTPLGVVGHMLCAMPWSSAKTFQVSLTNSLLATIGTASFENTTNGLDIAYQVNGVSLPLRMKPGPAEFLATSPEFLVRCQAAWLLAPVVIPAYPFVKELRGNVDLDIKPISGKLAVAVPALTVMDAITLKGVKPMVTEKALFLGGDVAPGTAATAK